jgi:periplasmic protein TonB
VFDHLIESRKQTSWRTALGNSAASIIFHVIMIGVAIYATLNAGAQVAERIQTVAVTMQTQEQKKEEPPPPEPEQVATVNPPPKGFQTLSIPTSIPVDIPPPTQNTNFNAADFSGVGVEGGVARGVEGGTGPVVSDQPYLEAVVEDRPEMIQGTCTPPVYPPILQQAGVEGRVLAEFVIDTLGRAERASLRFVSSTHELFQAPARNAILSCRFRPGRISGRAVRVRVQQPINFTISR